MLGYVSQVSRIVLRVLELAHLEVEAVCINYVISAT